MRKAAIVSIVAFAMVFAAALGCSKSGDAAGGGEKSVQKLGKLALQAELPGGAQISDAPLGEGVMIQAEGVTMTITPADDSAPKTVEAAREDADMYSPKNLKDEKLDGGWALSFENEGGAGKTFWLKARRDVGGKAYMCEVTSPYAEHVTNALAICKGMKP